MFANDQEHNGSRDGRRRRHQNHQNDTNGGRLCIRLSGPSLKLFGRAILTAARLNDEIQLIPYPDELRIRSSDPELRNWYLGISFGVTFFDEYSPGDVQLSSVLLGLRTKPLVQIFKRSAIEKEAMKCKIYTDPRTPDRLSVRFQWQPKPNVPKLITKLYTMATFDEEEEYSIETMRDPIDYLVAPAKYWEEILHHFNSDLTEVVMTISPEYIMFKNRESVHFKGVKTQFSVETRDFEDVRFASLPTHGPSTASTGSATSTLTSIGRRYTIFSFLVKEVRRWLHLPASDMDLSVKMSFRHGHPTAEFCASSENFNTTLTVNLSPVAANVAAFDSDIASTSGSGAGTRSTASGTISATIPVAPNDGAAAAAGDPSAGVGEDLPVREDPNAPHIGEQFQNDNDDADGMLSEDDENFHNEEEDGY